ncbi:MAG TPA: hypothetical protein DEB40_12955 [Elusimicrobia bacterium]|nr:hypothetical protein [Elusimicrobiota bacterium]HBT62643.1 hypothetical protein [Elusimicrobiota bacterium]
MRVENSAAMPAMVLSRFLRPSAGQGSGPGLALAHKIVQNHQDEIELDGTPGRGTAFTAFLPASAKIHDSGF